MSVSGRRCTEGGDQGGDQARGEMESCHNIEEVLECRTCLSVLHPIFPQDIYPEIPIQISKAILLVRQLADISESLSEPHISITQSKPSSDLTADEIFYLCY